MSRALVHGCGTGLNARNCSFLMATLCYAFLLTLLEPCYDPLRLWLLRFYCHRTGWHCRQAKAPLSRLRSALSRLWQQYPPNFAQLAQRRLPRVQLLTA